MCVANKKGMTVTDQVLENRGGKPDLHPSIGVVILSSPSPSLRAHFGGDPLLIRHSAYLHLPNALLFSPNCSGIIIVTPASFIQPLTSSLMLLFPIYPQPASSTISFTSPPPHSPPPPPPHSALFSHQHAAVSPSLV